jgi:outer membrane protein OmpA-like peptidoglycan-associated protein
VGEVVGDDAEISAVFKSAEEAKNAEGENYFVWDRDYAAEFVRNSRGEIRISSDAFRPLTRNVPVFPSEDLRAGDEWPGEGSEAHDLRGPPFNYQRPFIKPLDVQYKYMGTGEWKGRPADVFSINWSVDYTPPRATQGEILPVRVEERAEQTLYWDNEARHEISAEERWTMRFTFPSGETIEFRSKGVAELLEYKNRGAHNEGIEKTVEDALKDEGISDIEVRKTDEGITLSLDDIRFYADSDKFLPGETEKLDKISGLLLKFGHRALLVGGHTAEGGSAASRNELSRKRAEAVSRYLVERGVRRQDDITTRGYGSTRPVAPNSTEEGKRKNRRVEITILD